MSFSEAGKLGAIAAAATIGIKRQRRIEAYNQNPKLCKYCKVPIVYNKKLNDFCNHSCSAKFNNPIKDSSDNLILDACLLCFKPLIEKGQHKYCSRDCMFSFHWEETKIELLAEGKDNSANNTIGKKYLTELHQGKCQICNESEWQGQPMPLVLDHISGNPYDNSLNNLRVICHNCNAQTPTFTGRNKGNGRIERAKRWQTEKKILANIKADVV